MWMYFATLAYFLCGVYIIPESHWGEGLKPGMFTISPQEAEHGSLPLPPRPDLSIARTVGPLLNYGTKVKDPHKSHGRHKHHTLLIFYVLLKTFLSFDTSYSFVRIKFHMTIQKYWKAFFFLINTVLKLSALRALFIIKLNIHKLSTLHDICQALRLSSSMFYIYTGLDTQVIVGVSSEDILYIYIRYSIVQYMVACRIFWCLYSRFSRRKN